MFLMYKINNFDVHLSIFHLFKHTLVSKIGWLKANELHTGI